jgi:hypothetical protein
MKKNFGKQIVVIDNGFVHVGDCSLADGLLRIDGCHNVRSWGTKKGLGELVNGPLKSTAHDFTGLVLVPWGRIVFMVQVIGGW